jgi:hypothetical protein
VIVCRQAEIARLAPDHAHSNSVSLVHKSEAGDIGWQAGRNPKDTLFLHLALGMEIALLRPWFSRNFNILYDCQIFVRIHKALNIDKK